MFEIIYFYASLVEKSIEAVMKIIVVILVTFFSLFCSVSFAAPYAAIVINAKNDEVLHCEECDTKLHPAGLTKLITLYVVFSKIENGEISLDEQVEVSRKASAELPAKLGLLPGQKIKVRYLIRATAVMGSNDTSTALAEHVSGSEKEFAKLMNLTAKKLGMENSSFLNAHGMTQSGHLSTSRDMAIALRAVFYDFPEYFNLFSRRTANAGFKKVTHSGVRFLANYRGADAFRHGYTRASGFNGAASAERGDTRIITVVFGGRSTATRNREMAKLTDLGFRVLIQI
jgi:D-alanyl-D-alanine carboxypeptidase